VTVFDHYTDFEFRVVQVAMSLNSSLNNQMLAAGFTDSSARIFNISDGKVCRVATINQSFGYVLYTVYNI
jgi:hypothetical protein